MNRNDQPGFALIELVVIVIILGMLAAFAVPRFVSLEAEAREAAVESLGGSIKSAAALAHALWLAQGGGPTIFAEGNTIEIVNGYPSPAQIGDMLEDTAGFSRTATGLFTKDGAPDPATCSVTYAPPPAVNTAPLVTVDPTGCR
jgi:MSHA pilin protein MshA